MAVKRASRNAQSIEKSVYSKAKASVKDFSDDELRTRSSGLIRTAKS
jgi:hypothetical protein